MKPYDYQKTRGMLSNRELVTIAGKKGPLNDLAKEIEEAKSEVRNKDSDIEVEDLIGLLRMEANKMELAYIRAAESIEQELENTSREEMIERYIDGMKDE